MASFVRTILTEYLSAQKYALMDSDVVFDSEVMVELDNIATTRGSVDVNNMHAGIYQFIVN